MLEKVHPTGAYSYEESPLLPVPSGVGGRQDGHGGRQDGLGGHHDHLGGRQDRLGRAKVVILYAPTGFVEGVYGV